MTGRASAVGVHLASAAWVPSGHLFYGQHRIEERQATAAVLDWRGHPQQPLTGQLLEPGSGLLLRLGFERAVGQLAFGKVGDHALDPHLLFSEHQPASISIAASSMSTPSPAGSTSSALISILATPGGNAAASSDMRTSAAARVSTSARGRPRAP